MGRHLDEGPRGSGVQVIFVSEVAHSATVLHQPLIEPDDVKWRLAGQGAATVLNCAAQADIVRASALCRVVRGGDDVRQVEKRLIDVGLPGIDMDFVKAASAPPKKRRKRIEGQGEMLLPIPGKKLKETVAKPADRQSARQKKAG
jgi:hypothetical protein